MLIVSAMEQPESNDEMIKGDINLKYLHVGKTVTRRHAELVKTNDGKNDSNVAAKKGTSKNRKSTVEQSAMVSEEKSLFSAKWIFLEFFSLSVVSPQ